VTAPARPPLRHVLETVLYVDDLDEAARFYGGVLGLEEASRKPGVFVFYRLARQMLLLFDAEAAKRSVAVPPHGAQGAGHVAFAVADADLESWTRHLVIHGVALEAEVDWPNGGRSFYFRDPAGNSLEIAAPSIWGFDEALARADDER
jgi:catechol 2,3-dioxygenase-like lactoylglutathione lyase family enzyme